MSDHKTPDRRKLLKGAAAGAVAAGTLALVGCGRREEQTAGSTAATTPAPAPAAPAAPAVVTSDATTFRFQSTWPAKDIFHEFALDFAKKVNDMTGGDLKIEVLPAGAVVPAFGLLDAVSKGTLDGGHGVLVYHYGKQNALALWGSGPAFGMDANMLLSWHKYGGGKDLLNKLIASVGGPGEAGAVFQIATAENADPADGGTWVQFTVVDAVPHRLFSFRWTHADGATAAPGNSMLAVFELLSIVSVQDQKITALSQLVGILMEKQRLVEKEHRPGADGGGGHDSGDAA